jgi:hypothetical protein
MRQIMSATNMPTRVVLLLVCFVWVVSAKADEVTVERIRDAWKARDAATRSIQYVCKLIRSEVVVIGDEDPFVAANSQPNARVSYVSDLTFTVNGNKAACVHSGHLGWDSQRGGPRELVRQCIFDGKTGKVLYQGEDPPPAELTQGRMPDQLRNTDLQSVWLGYSPEQYFRRQGFYQLKRMEIRNPGLTWEDRRVVELVIPSDATPLALCMMYVDPDKGFSPVRAIEVFKGVPRRDVTLDYVEDDRVGWRLSSWSYAWGAPRDVSQSQGAVERCIVNEEIDDSIFGIQFPIGTHVRKEGTWLVQGADGQLLPK